MTARVWQKTRQIVDVKPKGDLVYPLSQHIGAPANSDCCKLEIMF